MSNCYLRFVLARLNYVNSFPYVHGNVGPTPFTNSLFAYRSVTAVRFGIQNLSSIIFESPPDIVLSGPNVGTNLGSGSNGPNGSGTVYVIFYIHDVMDPSSS